MISPPMMENQMEKSMENVVCELGYIAVGGPQNCIEVHIGDQYF